jgi:hypothetical protein
MTGITNAIAEFLNAILDVVGSLVSPSRQPALQPVRIEDERTFRA